MSRPEGVPTLRALTCDEVRAVDRAAIEDYGVPGVVLMENAGRGATDVLTDGRSTARVAICCGRGNNGGDGYVMARHLAFRGWEPEVHLFAEAASIAGDAAVNLAIIRKMNVPIFTWIDPIDSGALGEELARADWIVDGLLGTGLAGCVRPPIDSVIKWLNGSGKPILAIDIPSGLDGDTGEVLGIAIHADVTTTFVALKVGFTKGNAPRHLGDVHVIDIGVPRDVLAPYIESEN